MQKYILITINLIFICGLLFNFKNQKTLPESLPEITINENSKTEILTPININTANSEDLQMLTGIGPEKAANIIEYREANGDFLNIEDIMHVSGIGEKTFEKIKKDITVK